MVLSIGLTEWIILAATVCVLLYLYSSRHRNYWKDQNVPSEPFGLFFGPTLRLMRNPSHVLDLARYKQFGRIFGSFEMGKAVLFVGEPDLVKQILVKDFPSLPNRRTVTMNEPLMDNMMTVAPLELWRRIRPTASPAFSTIKLKKMNYLIEECAAVTTEHLKKAAAEEAELDLKQFFGNYSLDVIARCAFGTVLDSHSDASNEFVTKSRQAFSGRLTPRVLFFFFFPSLSRALNISPLTSEAFVYLKHLCRNAITERRKNAARYEDFLQLMVDAQEGKLTEVADTVQDRDRNLFNLDSEGKLDTSFSSKKTLTEDEAMAQCVLFFVAAQDTTSTAIANTLYLLAIHPEVQEKLRREADECFATHGEHPSLDEVTKLKYLHCVVSESLRMYPPAPRIERTPYADYTVGDTKIKVKKSDLVTIPVYAMHHDPEYFEDPFTFKPERFSDENVGSIQPYTYLPFGAGPRNCIGMRFALQAVKVSVLHTVRNVKLVRTEKTKVPPEFTAGLGLLTPKDVILGVRKRA